MPGCLRIVAIVALLTPLAGAQESATTPPNVQYPLSDRDLVQQLAKQVQRLQEKVAALEAGENAASSALESHALPPVADSSAKPIAETDTFEERHEVRGIRWRGFGEVNYQVLNERTPGLAALGFVPGSAGNFYSGDFDLFLTSKLTDKASVLAEVVIGEGDAQTFKIDLARALLKYDYNDRLKDVVRPLPHRNRLLQHSISQRTLAANHD